MLNLYSTWQLQRNLHWMTVELTLAVESNNKHRFSTIDAITWISSKMKLVSFRYYSEKIPFVNVSRSTLNISSISRNWCNLTFSFFFSTKSNTVLPKQWPGKAMLRNHIQGARYYVGLWPIKSIGIAFPSDAIGAEFSISIATKLDMSTWPRHSNRWRVKRLYGPAFRRFTARV